MKYSYDINLSTQAIDYLNQQAIALDKSDAEVLDLLKKLNRTFSCRLTAAKDDPWALVVAKVRTMMETYK